METGKWDTNDPTIKLFHKCADQLTVNHTHDISLKNNRTVIPEKLQNQVTQISHTGHQGVEKTKALLRERSWFTDMGLKVEKFKSSWLPCQTVAQPNRPKPLKITDTQEKPWSELSIGYYGPVPQTGQYLLVIIDNYSKHPEVEIAKSTDAKSCIPKMNRIFATHGVPDKLMSDSGPSFNPISTGGCFPPPICFLPVTFLLLSQFPPNSITFPKNLI